MKRLAKLIFLINIFIYAGSSAQLKRICGVPQLKGVNFNRILENTKEKNPQVYNFITANNLKKTKSVKDAVGDVKTFYSLNLLTNSFELVTAKLVKKGTVSQIWVDTLYLKLGWVSNNDINVLFNALENSTPNQSKDPTKGIIKLVKQYFGNPPDKDGDGITDFLLVQIHDNFDNDSNSPFTAGFFFRYDQTNLKGSNQRDILYIDIYPTIYYNGNHTPLTAAATIAHEFQHLIHYNYDKNEETFVNEGLSLNAEVICGYPLRSPNNYFKNTNIPLFNWNTNINGNDVIADYSRAALFTRYYIEQLGDDFIKTIIQDTLNGIAAFNKEFIKIGYRYRFNELFFNFCVANYLNNKKFGKEYYYKYNISTKPKLFINTNRTNGSIKRNPIYPYAVDYLAFKPGGKNLTVNLNAPANILSSAFLYGRDTSFSVSLLLERSQNFPEFGSTYKQIIFPVANISQNENKYSFLTTAEDTSTYWIKLNGPVTSQSTFNAAVTALTTDTANTIYAGIKDGSLWKSTDDGNSWNKIFENKYAGYDYGITSLAVDSSNRLYVGTADKFIFTSTDGGNTYSHLVNFNGDTLWSISQIFYLKSNNTVYALSGNPNVSFSSLMKSTNNGNNWTLVVDSVEINYLYIDSKENFYAAGSNLISVSTNKGATWKKYWNIGYQVPYFTGTTLFSIPQNKTVLLGTWNNGLMKFNLITGKYSQIGIENPKWQYQPFYRLVFRDSKNNYYLSLSDEGIYQSNTGDYWSDFNFNELSKQNIYSMAENRKEILFVGTEHNGVYRSKKGVITAVKKQPLIVSRFELKQNYPNPFNPSTTIIYTLAKESKVSLKIFNLLGQEITTLVETIQPKGKFKIIFNGALLPSGVYFYRLTAGNFTEVRKMILLK